MKLRAVNKAAAETRGRLPHIDRIFCLAALSLAALCGLATGTVRQAVAAQPMYVLGQLSVASLGNDTTTGASARDITFPRVSNSAPSAPSVRATIASDVSNASL